MKVKMLGPIAGAGPDGTIMSWGPDQVVEVDDADTATVAFYEARVRDGVAVLDEAPAEAKQVPADDAKSAAAAKPEAKPAKATRAGESN